MFEKRKYSLLLKYFIISIFSYSFVFLGLYLSIDILKVDESVAFFIIYGINYFFLFKVQIKYLFKVNFSKFKLVKYLIFIISFYIVANLLYNIFILNNIGYMISTILTVIILFPIRFLVSKKIVFK